MNSFPLRIVGLLIIFLFVQDAFGQSYSRSGFPADKESFSSLRRFPCGGNTILDDKFEADTISSDWLIFDEDSLAPRDEILFLVPNRGWQSVIDFKDSTNRALASASWHEDSVGQSDDYLVSPKVMIPNNSCLSWYAYSQDKSYPESYEIRVSTTTPDPAGFLANPVAYEVAAEGDDFTYRTISLEDYAGQEVYIAFRHTSHDQFILVLDDIRLAEVEEFDVAIQKVNNIDINNFDSTKIQGSIINAGLDTVAFDTTDNLLTIHYQIDDEEINNDTIFRVLTLLPNDTVSFVHDSTWYTGPATLYRLKVWISGFGVDNNVENDTVGRWQGVGLQTGLEDKLDKDMVSIYPNPFSSQINIDFSESIGTSQVSIDIFDLSGRLIFRRENFSVLSSKKTIDLGTVNQGIYLVKITHPDGRIYTDKIVKR